MINLDEFLSGLSNDNQKKLPPVVYGVKEPEAIDTKMVVNDVNRTNQYYCEPYYKPVTQIIDLNVLILGNGKKD
jgi:hypothetical protein